MSDKSTMTIHLKIWRQARGADKGQFVDYTVENVAKEMSFLEMLDILNEQLVKKGEEAVEYDNDCREGICGTCGLVIQGVAHGINGATTTFALASVEGAMAEVAHWGARLPDGEDLAALLLAGRGATTGGMPDVQPPMTVCPQATGGFLGHPGLMLRSLDGRRLRPEFRIANEARDERRLALSFDSDVATYTLKAEI